MKNYLISDSELDKIIVNSPMPDKKEFIRETVFQYANDLLELNDQATLPELARRLAERFDLEEIKNRIAFNVLRSARGMVRRSAAKGILIGFRK